MLSTVGEEEGEIKPLTGWAKAKHAIRSLLVDKRSVLALFICFAFGAIGLALASLGPVFLDIGTNGSFCHSSSSIIPNQSPSPPINL